MLPWRSPSKKQRDVLCHVSYKGRLCGVHEYGEKKRAPSITTLWVVRDQTRLHWIYEAPSFGELLFALSQESVSSICEIDFVCFTSRHRQLDSLRRITQLCDCLSAMCQCVVSHFFRATWCR